MKRSPAPWLLLAALLSAAPPAAAWTPATRMRMTEQALRFMPESLRTVLNGHRKALLRGVLEPMVHEDDGNHRPPWEEGTLDQEVANRAAALAQAVEGQAPFEEVARLFGTLAHFVQDADFPPQAAGDPGRAHFAHFSRFCESRMDRFPLVFYGHDDRDLARHDFLRFAHRILERSRREDRDLVRAYRAAGDPPDPAAFDDRSVPFAVASLSYSRTVTDTVRIWLAAWEMAHGDLGRTPYRKPAPFGARARRP